jgi:hypothetical protein
MQLRFCRQNRVESELHSNKTWEDRWGFMAVDAATAKDKEVTERLMNQTKGRTTTMSTVVLNVKNPAGHLGVTSGAADEFMHQQMLRSNPSLRPKPQEEFTKPTLSSHQIGWGKNLEVGGWAGRGKLCSGRA